MRDFLVTYLSPKLKLEENTTVNLDNSNHNGIDSWKTNVIQPTKDKYPKP